jgi:cytochrome c peroxidase
MRRKLVFFIILIAAVLSMRYAKNTGKANDEVAIYYDSQLDSLILKLQDWHKLALVNTSIGRLKKGFLDCRMQYKKISFFVEQFDTRNARLINGPDLLRIEDDTQNDSTFPHGFQHLEAMLYEDKVDRTELKKEIELQIEHVRGLRTAADHQYYFTHEKIWMALRSGSYRIISMGISGFDVPLSLNALPETKVQLESIKNVLGLYQNEIENKDVVLYQPAVDACNRAISVIQKAQHFDQLDRLTFVRDYMNPLSAQLGKIGLSMAFINQNERGPLNPQALTLFDADIFNIDFFSPNERYRMTPARIALGKQLFYDTKLSINNSRSCASCHNPNLAFTDGLPKGKHLDGKSDLLRNTPTLWNSVFQTRQFYDSRALVLETQLSAVVHSKEEMGGSLIEAIPVLAADAAYNKAFKSAYPNDKESISAYNIANAIASYIRTLVSFNSRFDQYMRHESELLSESEKNGFNLFMGKAKCGTCHYAPMFNGLVPPLYEETESEILAVPLNTLKKSLPDTDEGKYMYTQVPLHRYAFKTPGIRNIALTAPYMHNGVFKTLEEVIDFYDKGGGSGRGIHLENQTLGRDKLHLSNEEQKDIIAFLKTLTDTTIRKIK